MVAPYCLGISTRGVDVLRAVQVRGLSASGALGLGKLWTVADMVEPHLLAETFIPDDQNYNPDDSAMQIGLVGVSASPRRRNVIQKRRHTTVIQRT